jgi:cytochrome c2
VYGRNTWRNSYAIGTISTDKYAPIIKKNIYATLRPYLAFTRADGEKFISKKSYTKGPISLEPYYIIWKSPKSVGNLKKVRDHWPWKINKIFIFLKEPSELTASSPKFKPGQETFLNHCIACHSLNNLGGTKGADLAITTQKLSDEYLESYILNPRGTNPKSKMPQFPLYLDNKKARIKKLILYLRDKIKP